MAAGVKRQGSRDQRSRLAAAGCIRNAVAAICPFRLATMYYDDESGLYCDKMRYYLPDIQRWINRDPA
ncbi:MAG: RHS repeat-associated core domain-containing protein [Tepidisphaeraceae bacterium]|jgi:RHS repeat-associated protein